MTVTRDALLSALDSHIDPLLGSGLVAAGVVKSVEAGAWPCVEIELGFPAAGIRDRFADAVVDHLRACTGAEVQVRLGWRVVSQALRRNLQPLPQIRNIIAVASGKGGVGKSTVAANLALALQLEGARVGLLDADIYGPSQPLMLGAGGARPTSPDGRRMNPIEALGLQAMSIGFLIDDDQPMIWRGPMVVQALNQLLGETAWRDLDYLVIDLPPGTGDIQLTLSQKIPVSGAVIVTTPQDIALLDARKGLQMFRKVEVPVLGIVENMALYCCPSCGHTDRVFGAGGGEKLAREHGTELLGSLPLSAKIREQADGGRPTVIAEPDSPEAQSYRAIARLAAARLAHGAPQGSFPTIEIA